MNKFTKVMAAIVLMMLFAASCTKPDGPNNGGNNGNNDTIEEHEYVDLGLPSGTLWATCNVGADSPEGIGDYFAWGETRPKDAYGWRSYRYGDCVNDCFEMTKYCTDSCWGLNGFVDGLSILESIDDAATANWGPNWRMATKEEWEELYQNTDWIWTDRNGVKGRQLTGPNGNSIFLPAKGFYLDSEVICTGLGIYWSNTLHTGFPERGWSLHLDFESCHVCGTYERCRGQLVRAVRATQ